MHSQPPQPIRTVRVVLPSSPPHQPADLQAGVDWLREAGVEVVEPSALPDASLSFLAATDAARAADLLAALASDVDAVWCGRGGTGALRTLAAMGRPQLLGVHPDRPLLGLSDATALLLGRRRAGGRVVHAPVLTQLPRLDAASQQAVREWLASPGRPVALRAAQPSVLASGVAFGPLIGGNLSLLAACCGTPQQVEARGAILLLEDVGEPAYRIDRMISQLAAAGVLDDLAGLAVGTFVGCTDPERLDAVLADWASRLGVPACRDLPVGHGAACVPVELGLEYRLDADGGELAPACVPRRALQDGPTRSRRSATPNSVPPLTSLLDSAESIAASALARGVGSAIAIAVLSPADQTACVAMGRVRTWPSDQGACAVGPHSPFDLASLTKPMATLTILARELSAPSPRITLETRLAEVLPDARDTPMATATVRSLLGHASGAPAWLDVFAQTESLAGRPAERAAAVRALVLGTPLASAPLATAVYSDLGYMALGWLIEARLGAPLDRLFDELVAEPLGLAAGFRRISAQASCATAVAVATELGSPRAAPGAPLQGEVHDDNAAALDGVAGHAGLFASLADTAVWAQRWLGLLVGDPRDDVDLGISARIARLLATTSAAAAGSWRLGWDTAAPVGSTAGDRAGRDAIGHLGFTGTSVWLDPARRLGVVLLANRVHPGRDDPAAMRYVRRRVHDAIWRASDARHGAPNGVAASVHADAGGH